MAPSGDIDRLEALIRRFLADGIELNPDVLRTIDATLPDVSPGALSAALENPDNCERETLLDLIFFPDADFQVRIEPFLQASVFDKFDEAELVRRFIADPPRAGIHFDGGGGRFLLAMPEFVAGSFVNRLHICKRQDRELVDTLSACLSPPACQQACVVLRNCRMVPDGGRAVFLSSLIKKWRDTLTAEDTLLTLEFTLLLLEDLPGNGDIHRYLTARRDACLTALKDAQAVAADRRRRNMETIMIGSPPAPHVDIEAVQRQVMMIDDMLQAAR